MYVWKRLDEILPNDVIMVDDEVIRVDHIAESHRNPHRFGATPYYNIFGFHLRKGTTEFDTWVRPCSRPQADGEWVLLLDRP